MKVELVEGTTVSFQDGQDEKPYFLTFYPGGMMMTFPTEQAFLDFRDAVGNLWTEKELEDMRKKAGDSKCRPQ